MKIYIATPINNRPEGTILEKALGARERIKYLQELYKEHPDYFVGGSREEAEFCSTFDANFKAIQIYTEAAAMGRCVKRVMESDAVILDKADNIESKGMDVEEFVAKTYGKKLIYYLYDRQERTTVAQARALIEAGVPVDTSDVQLTTDKDTVPGWTVGRLQEMLPETINGYKLQVSHIDVMNHCIFYRRNLSVFSSGSKPRMTDCIVDALIWIRKTFGQE